MDKLIERTKDSYYDALQESLRELMEEKKVPKPDRIEKLIKNHLGTITKMELLERAHGISRPLFKEHEQNL